MTVAPVSCEFGWQWRYRKWRGDRYGHRCQVVLRGKGPGPRNILVRFQDGEQLVTTRFAVRRIKEAGA